MFIDQRCPPRLKTCRCRAAVFYIRWRRGAAAPPWYKIKGCRGAAAPLWYKIKSRRAAVLYKIHVAAVLLHLDILKTLPLSQ